MELKCRGRLWYYIYIYICISYICIYRHIYVWFIYLLYIHIYLERDEMVITLVNAKIRTAYSTSFGRDYFSEIKEYAEFVIYKHWRILTNKNSRFLFAHNGNRQIYILYHLPTVIKEIPKSVSRCILSNSCNEVGLRLSIFHSNEKKVPY